MMTAFARGEYFDEADKQLDAPVLSRVIRGAVARTVCAYSQKSWFYAYTKDCSSAAERQSPLMRSVS